MRKTTTARAGKIHSWCEANQTAFRAVDSRVAWHAAFITQRSIRSKEIPVVARGPRFLAPNLAPNGPGLHPNVLAATSCTAWTPIRGLPLATGHNARLTLQLVRRAASQDGVERLLSRKNDFVALKGDAYILNFVCRRDVRARPLRTAPFWHEAALRGAILRVRRINRRARKPLHGTRALDLALLHTDGAHISISAVTVAKIARNPRAFITVPASLTALERQTRILEK